MMEFNFEVGDRVEDVRWEVGQKGTVVGHSDAFGAWLRVQLDNDYPGDTGLYYPHELVPDTGYELGVVDEPEPALFSAHDISELEAYEYEPAQPALETGSRVYIMDGPADSPAIGLTGTILGHFADPCRDLAVEGSYLILLDTIVMYDDLGPSQTFFAASEWLQEIDGYSTDYEGTNDYEYDNTEADFYGESVHSEGWQRDYDGIAYNPLD